MALRPEIESRDFPSFRDHLKEMGSLARITARAEKMAIAIQLANQIKQQKLSKTELAARMGTSRAQLDRILDPHDKNVTIDSLARAAQAVGCTLHFSLR